MDLSNIILDFELTMPRGRLLAVGQSVYFMRGEIVNEAGGTDRVVRGEIIEIKRHDITRNVLFKVKADGFIRTPYLTKKQLLDPDEFMGNISLNTTLYDLDCSDNYSMIFGVGSDE